jgi:hypothetical protein
MLIKIAYRAISSRYSFITSTSTGNIFSPIVLPNQANDFENFAYEYFESDPSVPDGAGTYE